MHNAGYELRRIHLLSTTATVKSIDPEESLGQDISTFSWHRVLALPRQVGSIVLTNAVERVMNSIRNGLGMREREIIGGPSRPWNPHFYAIFAQVHNTL